MSNLAEKYPWMQETRYLGKARVVDADENEGRVMVQLSTSAGSVETWAAVAIAGTHELALGDIVLAAGEDLNEMYIIGLLKTATLSPETISLSGGTSAEASGKPGEQKMKVFSAKKELLFEYDEATGTARVNMPSGDLEFVAEKGNISFQSGQDISFHGHHVDMKTHEIGVSAHRGDLRIEEAVYTGRKLLGNIGHAKLIAERLETAAQTMIEKAQNLFQSVEELSQLKAGRMRTLVKKTFHFKSNKAFVKAEEDYKIRAEKIHLG
ncbi:MAG TPA: DUF3540 domain-containing protein [Deltaproteobacteria bacterium]|nr:DUF3540 domain-containing protein [Deltaproteobacteria bacterium]HPJ92374.1 DUF3540 domain-containing protein [Deltaproteobacteria bacterium]HPR52758.1 DUF3540 domain-containing protein [Deltaproteobacteria bacterium]